MATEYDLKALASSLVRCIETALGLRTGAFSPQVTISESQSPVGEPRLEVAIDGRFGKYRASLEPSTFDVVREARDFLSALDTVTQARDQAMDHSR